MIRLVDLILAILGLLLLAPLFLVIAVAVALGSPGGAFFRQNRVGKDGKDFLLLKFRTMGVGSEKGSSLTVGADDLRITGTGRVLRKYKLDELPQLINVVKGEMSLVGPRPEVRKYVELYTEEQRNVLQVRPGITDYASLEYFKENELLAAAPDPEQTYIRVIMPAKLELNRRYLENRGISSYFRILGKTLLRIISE